MTDVLADEFGTDPADDPVPVFGQSGDARRVNAEKMLTKRVPVLPHGLFNSVEKVGERGETLVEYVRWLADSADEIGGSESPDDDSYDPRFHVDVYGVLGDIFGAPYDRPEVVDYFRDLREAAGDYALSVEGPMDAGGREDQIRAMCELRDALADAGVGVDLVADEWCNTLDDVRRFVDAGAADFVQVKTPDLGGIGRSAEAVLACRGTDTQAYLGGTCNETDTSARACAHVALATDAAQVLAKPGMGFDEGFMIVTNEMKRTISRLPGDGRSIPDPSDAEAFGSAYRRAEIREKGNYFEDFHEGQTIRHDPGLRLTRDGAELWTSQTLNHDPAYWRTDAAHERGFDEPTEPQRLAVPPIAAGEHALVVAPTGTGKTETAMLPVFDAIAEADPRFGISALYVTPLRALNRDMRDRLEWWGEYLDVDVDVRHGDTTDYQRQKQANDPPDVLVTTPETLQAMLTGKKLRRALADVRHVVVDEVHELASSKRGAQLTVGLERLQELSGEFQRIGLSATVGTPEEVGRFLTGDRGCEVVEVDVGSNLEVEVLTPEITPEDERLAGKLMTDAEVASHVRAIRDLVERHESTLVFVNTRQTAEALGSRFKELDVNIGVHHGSLSKEARIETEDQFKAGDIDALLCTSSMELGIDVGRIDHVVQYQSPREVARLLQRVGRAGHRRDVVSSGTIVAARADDVFESLAITRMAMDGEVEPANVHDGSLDVVANQVVGLLMDFGEIGAMRAYQLVRRAYPFRDLDREAFKDVVSELSRNRLLWLDEEADRLEKSGGTWQYYYANLSMIPDEATYRVEDIASGRQVGTLDERFVVNFAQPGEVFIQRGEMWRITNVDEEEERVQVTPIDDPGGEVPSWVGQEIPVPYPVAQHVGRLRAETRALFDEGRTREAVSAWLRERYPTDEYTAEQTLELVENHTGPLPTDDRVVVEFRGREVVANACFGHQVNETLGRLVSALLGQQTGSSVAMEIDPYRIELEVPRGVTGNDVAGVLRDTDPEHVQGLIELSLKNADVLKFKLAQVAAKFGALKRWKGKGSTPFGRDRLLAALRETPMYDEALREVLHEDLDVPGASDVLRRVQSEDIGLDVVGERTAIGVAGRSSGRELLSPENADASVIQTVRDRIQDDDVRLLCLHCTEWERKTQVKRVPEKPECPNCGSTRIAALHPWADDVVQAVRSNDRSEEQEEMTERAYRNASLVQSHGKQAVIALTARGVGPHNAARIISKLREDEEDFYRDILEQERRYAQTRSFWD